MRVRVFFLCALTGPWAGLRYQLIKAIHVLQETQDLDQGQDLRLGTTLNTFKRPFRHTGVTRQLSLGYI